MSTFRIVGVSGSLQVPSKTDVLIAAVADAVAARLPDGSAEVVQVTQIPRTLAGVVYRSDAGPELESQLEAVEGADLLVVGSPVYKGTYTGLFKHFFDLLDQDALAHVPVLLTATGGSDRHALVLDFGLRPLFSFFRAETLPWGIYANSGDFDGYTVASAELSERIESTAAHAADVLERRALGAPARGA